MKQWFAFFLPFVVVNLAAASPPQTGCIVNDKEEYAVLAAVLFPNEPEIPDDLKSDLEKKAHLARAAVRLEGFHNAAYAILDTTAEAQLKKETDRFLMEDFNKKNRRQCKLERSMLLSFAPEGGRVDFLTSAEARKKLSFGSADGGEGLRGIRTLTSGFVSLSRPGFSKDRNRAVVEANHLADYEMGVGYRVYLEKSKKTGRWILTGADRTRIY